MPLDSARAIISLMNDPAASGQRDAGPNQPEGWTQIVTCYGFMADHIYHCAAIFIQRFQGPASV